MDKTSKQGRHTPGDERGSAPVRDLRDWLECADRIGELLRIGQPVDRDEEMSAIGYLVAKQQPSPAVLFESARGFE